MAELKTKQTDADVRKFLDSYVENEEKHKDSLRLLQIMEETTGYAPKMWGDSMIGFGSYHYKSARSSQEGDWFLVGFSPRKSAISLYVYSNCSGQELLLKDLGKYKMGKACIYVKKLSDIDLEVLREIIKSTVAFLEQKHNKD